MGLTVKGVGTMGAIVQYKVVRGLGVGWEGCGVGWVSVGWVLREWVGCGGQRKGCFGFPPKLNYRGTNGLL